MNCFSINPKDNVAVVLDRDQTIPYGHKIALRDIQEGEQIIKYGFPIGRAKKDIKKGDWVHSHNLESGLSESFSYSYHSKIATLPQEHKTFMGYPRKWGFAGIRNDIYIIPTVGCVNGVCKELERRANELELGSIDGIFALTHQFGCSQLGDDHANIGKLLSSLALNPNATCVLFVGLGCENNAIQGIRERLEPHQRENVAFFSCQDQEDEVAYGMEILRGFIDKAKGLRRVECDCGELVLGLKCGGSDAFSGISANPTVGKISDAIVSYGGSAILTEVPEMFGAEQILMDKCISEEIYQKYLSMISDFKKYYTDLGFPIYENPSPGNKEGGITTLEEKSLGCVAKAGSSPIVDVLDYAEPLKRKGLCVLNGPGNDLIAATALAASGCQVILFTTGRGTPFSSLVPTLKISSNAPLAKKKNNWIDFDASTMDADGLLSMVLRLASGDYRAKEESNREIAFFKKGVTL